MRIGVAFGWAILGGLVIVACGSSSSSSGADAAAICIPGASVACTGVGSCSGGHVCNQSGTGYGDCLCGASTDSGPPSSDAGSDANAKADGDVEASVDSGPSFSPKDLSNLLLWVDGENFGDAGTTITDWPDQSPAHSDLLKGSASAPTIHLNAIGGLSAATFTAFDFLGANASELGTSSFVVEMVANPTVAAAFTLGCASGSSGYAGNAGVFYLSSSSTTAFASFAGTATSSKDVPISSGPHVFGLHRTSAIAAELRVDGTATAMVLTSQSLNSAAPDFEITADGDLAEIVVAESPTDADVTKLEAYLNSKYGL